MKRIARTKARSAYALLAEIVDIILAEPKRYDQGQWVQLVEEDRYATEKWPVCGTIGCVAGWCQVLTKGRMLANRQSAIFTGNEIAIQHSARKTLGLSEQQAGELFDGQAVLFTARKFNLDITENRDLPRPGTVEYANLGAAHIMFFMREHAAQLKRTRL